MRVRFDRRLVGLGSFLVAAGATMLTVRQNLITDALAGRAWTLWPLLLVGAGLSIVLAGRPAAALGGLLIAVTLGVMLGGVAAAGWSGDFGACGGEREGTPFSGRSGEITPGAAVRVEISCGRLDVGTLGGTSWSVSGTSPDGGAPDISTDAGGLEVRNAGRGPFAFGSASNHWSVVVPRDPGIDLDLTTNGGASRVILAGAALGDVSVETNAGSLELDLRGVTALSDLDVHANLGSSTIRLPDRNASGSLEVNAGSAALCLPAGAGLRVVLDGVAASNDLGSHGLTNTGDAWETPGYATAATRLDLRIRINAGSLALDPARECAG